ncbi:MAG: transcriptional regulator, TetR family [Acidimicrobiales bacterium]|jgi:AcrR family transcriptional regulator|nr:transcriptional regulator, TetR family [Acidimicrobiales bacterium]
MPRSPEPARRQILDAALRLFARNGISGTSLREIRLAAKQGNAGALHYHFGDKEGLLRALLERELPLLVERRKTLLVEAADVRSVAAVFVLPFAQLATGTEHERDVVQLLSQLHDDVSFSVEDITGLIGDTGTRDAYVLLRERVAGVSDEVLGERVRVGINSFLHAAAIWARGERRVHQVSDEVFCSNLVDMFLGAVTVGGLDR